MKARLWGATAAEVTRFASKYASLHERGARESEGQREVAVAAKARGYAMGLVRDVARCIRNDKPADGILGDYRAKIGL